MNEMPPQRIWKVATENRAATSALAQALGESRLFAHLLVARGIDTVERARAFLAPNATQLTDPFLLTDMAPAVERLRVARERRERVLVFGDYDVDGISGTALLFTALRRFGIADCRHLIPSRLLEGYGLSPEHVETAREDGVQLIVTVDNGIAAHEAARVARDVGIGLIVTDHHEIDRELPVAAAAINPKREAPEYPGVYASGSVVAFKLACALATETDPGEVPDIDLASLGAIADIVPLRAENRTIVALGLQTIARRPRIGLQALAAASKLDLAEVSSENVAFQLAPRLNAAGRLGGGMMPLQLLLTGSKAEACEIAAALNDANEERKYIEQQIFDEAVGRLEEHWDSSRHSIVMASRSWHPGVVGIVASRLLSRYQRPVVLMAVDENGVGRGSARSMSSFDLVGVLSACQQYLVRFGGHAAAAGLTLLEENVALFSEAFEAVSSRRFTDTPVEMVLDIDAQVSLSEIDGAFIKTLEQLEPCGNRNPSPVFCAYGVSALPGSFRELRGGHVKFAVRQGPTLFQSIGFNMAAQANRDIEGHPVDIAFTPKLNTWRGETTVQLVLKDLRPG